MKDIIHFLGPSGRLPWDVSVILNLEARKEGGRGKRTEEEVEG
jgi:hypothetical protein